MQDRLEDVMEAHEKLETALAAQEEATGMMAQRNRRLAEANVRLARENRRRSEFLVNACRLVDGSVARIERALAEQETVVGEQAEDPPRDGSAPLLACRSARGLLTELSDLARLDAGSLLVEPQRVALRPLVEKVRTEYCSNRHDRKLRVEIGEPEGLPGMAVQADPTRLEQVLHILLEQAAPQETDRELVLRVWKETEHARSCIEVEDPSLSLPIEQFHQIFSHPAPESLGREAEGEPPRLSLALCAGLVELMGGTISARQLPGDHGTRVRLALPLFPAARQQYWRRREDRDRALEIKGPQGPLVLVVEDEPAFRGNLLHLLRGWGYATVHSVTADDASHAAHILRPRIAMVDYGLLCRSGATLRTGWDLLGALAEDPTTRGVVPLVLDEEGESSWRRLRVPICTRRPDIPTVPVDVERLTVCLQPVLVRLGRAGPPHGGRPACRVLLAEERQAVAQFVQKRLEEKGIATETVSSGSDALRRLKRRPDEFDALLLNLRVPGVSGAEVIRALRLGGLAPDLPVIALLDPQGQLRPEERSLVRDGTFLETIGKGEVLRRPEALRSRLAEILDSSAEPASPAERDKAQPNVLVR